MLVSMIPTLMLSAVFGLCLLATTLVTAAVIRSGQIDQMETQAMRVRNRR